MRHPFLCKKYYSDRAERCQIRFVLHEQVAARRELYGRSDMDLTSEEAMDEIAADYAGRMMEDGAFLDKFIQSHSADRTLLEKIRDAFRELVRKLTGAYKTQAGQVEHRLTKALEAAEKQVAKTKPAGYTESTKYSMKEEGPHDGEGVQGTGEGIGHEADPGRGRAGTQVHGKNETGRSAGTAGRLIADPSLGKDMTEDETAALLSYKSSESYKVNAKLRDGLPLTETERKMVEALDSALEKLPKVKGTVYRTLNFDALFEPEGEFNAFMELHTEGAFAYYNAYTSASTEADGYPLADGTQYGVTMEISNSNARDLAGFGNNFESEALFPRGTDFIIRSVGVDEYGYTHIIMEEAQTDGERNQPDHDTQERGAAVRDLQEAHSLHGDLQGVSERNPGRNQVRESGLRGTREEVKFSLKGSEELTREIDRIVREGKTTGRSDTEIQADIRAAVDTVYRKMVKEYGAIKPGERAARKVEVPKRTADDKKVSQTVRTILEAGATPDAAIPNIEQLTAQGDFSYEVITDKAAMTDADAKIRDKGYQTALLEWSGDVREGKVSKANTAMGWALYNAAANEGDLKTAMSILTQMVEHQRNAAQAVQATRILKKMSPDAQL